MLAQVPRLQRFSGPLRDRGAAAVEFALVLPFLLAVMFAAIDGARVFNAAITLNEAAGEGARSFVSISRMTTSMSSREVAWGAIGAALYKTTVAPEAVDLAEPLRCRLINEDDQGPDAPRQVTVTLFTSVPLTLPVGSWRSIPVSGKATRLCSPLNE